MAQIAEGCRTLFTQAREASFAAAPAFRCFVSENRTERNAHRFKNRNPDATIDDTGIPTYPITKLLAFYGKGISNDFTTHCASLSRMNQYSE